MTVANNYAPVLTNADGVTTIFTGPWNAISAAYLVVELLNISTGLYTVINQGAAADQYQVTSISTSGFVIAFNTAPTSGNQVVITRLTAAAQTVPFTTSRGFQGSVEEQSFDLLTAVQQENSYKIGRTLLFPSGSTYAGVLPAPTDDTVLAWSGVNGSVKNGPTTASLVAGATSANASASAAASSATSAASSATSASASVAAAPAVIAAGLIGTSTSSVAIATGAATFTTQSGKAFTAGNYVMITSNANPTVNFMNAQITSYSGTTLVVNTVAAGGSGTHTDWTINISGVRGAQGPQGTAGAGTGDMLGANNLSDVSSASTSRTNLGLGTAAVQANSFFCQTANNLSDVANAATTFGNIKQTGTSSATGALQLATNAQAITGTNTSLAVTPAGVAAYVGAQAAITPSGILGTWATGYSTNTSLLAATDLIVIINCPNAVSYSFYTDSANPPTTKRGGAYGENSTITGTYVVKKGDYWKFTGGGVTAFAIPLGS